MKLFSFSDEIILENDRVLLEPLSQQHFSSLEEIIKKDTGLMKYSSTKLDNEADLLDYFKITMEMKTENSRYPLAIFDKKTGKYVGSTSFCTTSNKDGCLEIGYTWMGYDTQRTGLNSAIKYLMLQYAFETLGFSRVEFRADSRNQQSRNAMERIGGIFEGELRSRAVKPDGCRSNTVFYGILANECPAIKREKFELKQYHNEQTTHL
jgi:RimJ/RimL family protein N-acetyltransferase